MSTRDDTTPDVDARIDALVRAARNEAPPPSYARDALTRAIAHGSLATSAPVSARRTSPLATATKLALLCAGLSIGAYAVKASRGSIEPSVSSLMPAAPTAVVERSAPTTVSHALGGPTPSEGVEPSSANTFDVHRLPNAPSVVSDSGTTVSAATTKGVPAVATTSSAPVEGDDFAAEIARLREARAAISAGRIDDARATLARYDATFPKGALMPEAKAMKVDLLIAAGQPEEARREAEAFLKRYPNSPQAGRLKILLERKTVP
ncbi:hypothetical protein AKJ09_07006 [Labilithrix luteola]|uniref:Outer membrane lipoprotein BamD-like domain-containing protein n=1 Tax=Labilithrix luteola TaxID=1391654 RepID=A0A0K1Q3L8_9BACT|nr:tetratricopeptide repeat protein [Labilithrix luteola]AKV00343.1 hypothetical protein AKJ09_07006 [Labilithrix luteola]